MAARQADVESTASETRGADETSRDSWPWQCLDCGTTIFHDGECCRTCRPRFRPSYDDRAATDADGFFSWTATQRPSQLVLKVTAIAGAELLLTAVWLRAGLHRALLLGAQLPPLG